MPQTAPAQRTGVANYIKITPVRLRNGARKIRRLRPRPAPRHDAPRSTAVLHSTVRARQGTRCTSLRPQGTSWTRPRQPQPKGTTNTSLLLKVSSLCMPSEHNNYQFLNMRHGLNATILMQVDSDWRLRLGSRGEVVNSKGRGASCRRGAHRRRGISTSSAASAVCTESVLHPGQAMPDISQRPARCLCNRKCIMPSDCHRRL